MISIRPVAEINEKRSRKSIQAYLEDEQDCNLKWILGVIGSERPLARRLLLSRFGQYSKTQSYLDLWAYVASSSAY